MGYKIIKYFEGIRDYHGPQKYQIFHKNITIKRAVNIIVLGVNSV